MLKWLSGTSSWRFCHQFMLAEVQGCLGLASLSLLSFTLFPQVMHKQQPAPGSSFSLSRFKTNLLSFSQATLLFRPQLLDHRLRAQLLESALLCISNMRNAPLQPKEAVHGQTPPLTSLTTPLTPWQPSTCSSPAVPAHPNLCSPSRLNLTAFPQSTLFCWALCCPYHFCTPVAFLNHVPFNRILCLFYDSICFSTSSTHHDTTSQRSSTTASFQGSLICPLLLRCWQQINQNTAHVYILLLLPLHTTISLLPFFKLLLGHKLFFLKM